MFKSLKDAKRRVSQAAFEVVDHSNKTVDNDYATHIHFFPEMVKDMNECGAALTSVMVQQKKAFTDSNELATSLARIYTSNAENKEWTNTKNQMEQHAVSLAYKECWDNIHDVYRSSSSMVCLEHALEPFRAAVTRMVPEVEGECRIRDTNVTDYDSYRRRLKDMYAKKEREEHKPNPANAPNKELERLSADINRFEGKRQIAEEAYVAQNTKTQDAIIGSKVAHDVLMDMLLTTVVVCQAEMFSRAARDLEKVVALLPQDKVSAIRQRIEKYVQQGGVHIAGEQTSSLTQGLNLLSGKTTYAELGKEKEAKKKLADDQEIVDNKRRDDILQHEGLSSSGGQPVFAPPPAPPSIPVPGTVPMPPSMVPFAAPPAVPNAPPPAIPEAYPINSAGENLNLKHMSLNTPPAAVAQTTGATDVLCRAKAMFEHVSEEMDELGFAVGDIIEVIDTSDPGWWVGRHNNKTGLFPVNYVQVL